MLNINIKELMLKNNLTVTEISKASGISRTTINNLVNGKNETKALQLETMYQLSAIFGVTMGELFQNYSIPYELQFNFDKLTLIESEDKNNHFSFVIPVVVKYNNLTILEHFVDIDTVIYENNELVSIFLQPTTFLKIKLYDLNENIENNDRSFSSEYTDIKKKLYMILAKSSDSEVFKIIQPVRTFLEKLYDISDFSFSVDLNDITLDKEEFC